MNMFLKTYKDLRREEPWIPRAVTFRSVCQTIIQYGTFDDIKKLNAYYEQELEESKQKGVFN